MVRSSSHWRYPPAVSSSEPGPVEIMRYHYRHQAEMAQGLLADAGIDSAIVSDDAGGMYAGIAAVRLLVASEDASRANQILEELEEA